MCSMYTTFEFLSSMKINVNSYRLIFDYAKLYDYFIWLFLILKTYLNDFLFKNFKILLFVDHEILNFCYFQVSQICILEMDYYF